MRTLSDKPMPSVRAGAALVAIAAVGAIAGCGGDRSVSPQPSDSRAAQEPVSIVATASDQAKGPVYAFHSEKELLAPTTEVTTGPAQGTSPGFIFVSPRAADPDQPTGPMTLDSRGRLVWFNPREDRVTANFRPQTYKGKPVLTWGERPPVPKPADLYKAKPEDVYNVVVDQSYKEIAKVRPGNGAVTDLHDMTISKRNTALVLAFRLLDRDLSEVGGSADGSLIDGVVQEIDIETGKVLLDWSSIERVPITDSMTPPPPSGDWDYFHVNSVAEDTDGNLLISARHTSAVYKIDRKTGDIIWTLGGKRSDFEVDKDARFYFQHDAQRLPNGNLMLLDNAATEKDHRAKQSSVLELRLNEKAKTARLVKRITRTPPTLAESQGNARRLPNGNIFVGWGNEPYISEFTPQGQQLFDARMPSQRYQSYRAFKGPWRARPTTQPAIVADRTGDGRTLIWASWNGATEVAKWQVLGGPSESAVKALGTADWQGFETKLDVAAQPTVVAVQALDRAGKVIGTSVGVRPGE